MGFKLQCGLVEGTLLEIIFSYISKGTSVVIEGVHILSKTYREILEKNLNTLCFIISIDKEERHMSRFAVRSPDGTIDPSKNKYVLNFKSIRIIQKFLKNKAEKYHIPIIENSNIDKSLGIIHSTVM